MPRVIKKIVIPKGHTPQLCKEFGVSRACVFNALSFRSNSELSEVIRTKAVREHQGILTKGY